MFWNNEDCYNEGVKDGENAARKEYNEFWLKRLKELQDLIPNKSAIQSRKLINEKISEWIDEIENSD